MTNYIIRTGTESAILATIVATIIATRVATIINIVMC
jgi:riboflavin transporter FmnP